MSFIVTARKWRPQTFSEVVGQEHITTTIKNAIINNRVAHAYLFTGPRGCGKTTTARILAKTLNCLNVQNGEPCNECEMCKSFLNSQTLDIIEIDGASNRRIEEIRTLRESVKYTPTKGKYKVYIIDEVHMLTTESFNALLKTLEEPPEHTIFIFATTDVHKVPLTIISRCQRFDFRRIEISVIKEHLKKIAEAEKIEIDDISLTLIAKKADGALRDAQSIFDQIISFSGSKVKSDEISQMFNQIDEEIFFTVSDSILNKNFNTAFEITKTVYENGWSFIDFLNGLNEHFRNIMTVVIRKDTKLIEEAEYFKNKYLEYVNKFSEGDLLRILNFINKTQYELKTSFNQKMKIEIALCNLIGLEKSSTITSLISKINSGIISEPSKTYSANIENKQLNITSQNKNTDIKLDSKLTEINNFEPPTLSNSTDFNEIISKWRQFVDQVKTDKLIFGSILDNTIPIDINNDKLNLEVIHEEDWEIIKENKSYLDIKTKEIFGKKIEFNKNYKKKTGIALKETKHIENSTLNDTSSNNENSIVNAVITKLGGKEITK